MFPFVRLHAPLVILHRGEGMCLSRLPSKQLTFIFEMRDSHSQLKR
jgi:hypothetical protein